MLTLWPADERGTFDLDWLQSRQTFSFGEFYDPAKMGWRSLRVINDDHIAPGGGFPLHPHRDMEIFSYLLAGELEHRDSLGTTARIASGRAQFMSAGTGLRHSEYNPSKINSTHLFQIWILPRAPGGPPAYQEIAYTPADTDNRLKLLADPQGADGSMTIRQDARIHTARLAPGQTLSLPLAPRQGGWLQLLTGALTLGQVTLTPGDACACENEPRLAARATIPSEFLWFTFD